MEQVISLSAAKAHRAGLVQAAETGDVVHISRHGKPVAVLISEQLYIVLEAQQAGRRVWTAIAEWREAADATDPLEWPLPPGSCWRAGGGGLARSIYGLRGVAWVRVLLDTNVLSEPLLERPDPAVMAELEHGAHALHTASVVLHELSYCIHRLAAGRKQERLNSYLQALLASSLTVLPYDRDASLWHGAQRAQLEARGECPPFADRQIAAIAATQKLVLVTRNTADFAVFEGLEVRNWFSQP
jgi:tRNA(fMet)-specific endonuclease VapC